MYTILSAADTNTTIDLFIDLSTNTNNALHTHAHSHKHINTHFNKKKESRTHLGVIVTICVPQNIPGIKLME